VESELQESSILSDVFERMQRSSHLAGQNAAYVEALYEAYLTDPVANLF